MSSLARILVCLLLFGWGTEGLTPILGNTLAIIISGAIAFAINRAWHNQQAQDRRQNIVHEEQLRMEVRARHRDEGRPS